MNLTTVDFFDRAPCGLLVSTHDGTILEANGALARLVKKPVEELRGQSFASLLSVGGRIFHETHYAPMLAMHGEAREIAFDLVTADGQRVPVLVSSSVERHADPASTRIRTVVFEASDRRTFEQELLLARSAAQESEARAIELAKTLQESFIPPEPPRVAGLEVAAVYGPAGNGEEVGGDFYDIFQIGEDEWTIALGDVSGKGAKAAAVTSFVRRSIRASAIRTGDPVVILRELNTALLANETERFCTVVLVHLRREREGWSVTVGAGGHPLPLLRDPDGDVREIGRPGSLIGVLDEASAHGVRATLARDQTVVLYTDGVTEARRGAEIYGESRLRRVVSSATSSPRAITEAVLTDVLRFQHDDARDDIAVIAFAPAPMV